MRRLLGLGLIAACALAAGDARATAAVLFSAGGNAHVDAHKITVTLGATGTVTWDSIDVSGSPTDIGLVVAVKAGGRVEITQPGFVSATDLATRVVVKPLPTGVTCNSVGAGVDFDASATAPPVNGGGTGSGKGSGSGGCGGSSTESGNGSGSGSGSGGGCGSCDDNSSSSKGEATGGCLTSSQGGCGSCDDNGGGCDPSEHGHPGCSALHGCGPKSEFGDDDDDTTPRDSGGSVGTFGPYEETRIQSGDGSAQRWLDAHGYQAPPGFLDGLLALEADGYEVHAFRARAPAPPSIVKSLRVVTTSPSKAVPLRLVRMSTGADTAATPVTLITLAGTAQDLVGQPMVSIDETKLASVGGSGSNYETLVSAALGTPPPSDAGDAGSSPSDAGDAGFVSQDTRWLPETSRSVSATTTTTDAGADGGSSSTSSARTLGDYFREACGERKSEPHLVCSDDDEVLEAGAPDADSPDADSAEAGAADAGAPDASSASDGGTTELDAGCKNVARDRCDDLSLALPAGVNVASRFRGVVGGDPALVPDLAFSVSAGPLREGRYTVRPTGEPGLCAPVADQSLGSGDGDLSGSADASTSCKAVRKTRFRIDLGPLLTVLVVIRVLTAVMRRGKRRK